MVQCTMCKKYFIHSCVDLTTAEVRSIKTKQNINWTCSRCPGVGESISELKSLILTLQEEIKTLRCNNETKLKFEEVIQELTDRNRRKSNIMVYGLTEDKESSKDEQKRLDQTKIKEVLNFLEINTDNVQIKPIRLGTENDYFGP
ncbi:unnamed protein product [Brassicogethes aeneus]|uniref:Uncharacterized protein n=1 Tax=Brassicogethes aeneus TaxID=1431903 RepID=A0A9P0B6S1_BRAAE|nr:unnamed protein product [Brassicogethes aeneus]